MKIYNQNGRRLENANEWGNLRSRNRIYGMVVAIGLLLPIQASASGRISKLTFNVGIMEVSFDTTIGDDYQLQSRSSLSSGIWEDVGTSAKATEIFMVLEAPANQAQCFFRVLVSASSIPVAPGDPPLSPPPPPGG